MSKACTVKLKGKLFAVNLTWFDFSSKKEVEKTAKLLKSAYGVSFYSTFKNQDGFKEKKITVGLGQKKFSACYSLAAVIANKYKSGIFITDKLIITDNSDISTKLYWVCMFQNKEPIVKVELKDKDRTISVSGDELLSASQLTKLIDIYTSKYTTSIFCDLNDYGSLNIQKSIDTSLDDLASSRIAAKFLLRKVHTNFKPYVGVGSLCVLGLLSAFFYTEHLKSHQEQLEKAKEQQIVAHKKTQATPTELVLKEIKTNSASVVFNSIISFLKQTPVVIAGWSITSIGYTQTSAKKVQLLYKINDGMDIVNAKSKAKSFISKNNLHDASILFLKNDQIMQLDIGLEKVSLPLISDLTKDRVVQEINLNNGIATIAAVQHNYLNYRLASLTMIDGKYSKQAINISNIDALIFQTITELANQHNNLVVNSIIGTFDNNFNISWVFNGSIYE